LPRRSATRERFGLGSERAFGEKIGFAHEAGRLACSLAGR
jgi:hypothetical protein